VTINLLTNPGFNAAWGDERSHDVAVFPVGGEPYLKESGNIFTPPGWLTWFRHLPGAWDQPEVKLLAADQYPGRVSEGRQAVCQFSFGRNHDAGFMQTVTLPNGRDVTVFLRSVTLWPFRHNDAYWDAAELTLDGAYLTFRAKAHAWSNHNDAGFPHPNDPAWSEGAGYEALALDEADVPPLNGDPQNDAIGNFTFYLGIGLDGGQYPFDASVVWGPGRCIYNEYADVPAVTVRVPGLLGQPRVQYARTYVLLPPSAGAAWAQAVVGAGWDARRWTIGGSADDAGIADLDDRRVIAVNPHLWDGDLCAWFAEHYPGVVVECIDAASPAELGEKLGA
jgi:hypothetical protein